MKSSPQNVTEGSWADVFSHSRAPTHVNEEDRLCFLGIDTMAEMSVKSFTSYLPMHKSYVHTNMYVRTYIQYS